MTVIAAYLAALVVFLGVDAVWLKLVMRPLFEAHVGELLRDQPQIGVAAGFYAIYVAGVIYFAVWPALQSGTWTTALGNGAILGFLAYGTYEATNMATLKGWSYSMVAADMAWGTVLTAGSAMAGLAAARWAGG